MSEVVQIGQILAGKYRVERVLGQGGMGVVVAATHLQLGQLFALKFLLPHMCEHGEAVARFAREARAAVQIQSEHVARVSDVGTLESGAPYMVMEYLQGSDLSDVLQARGPLPIAEAVGFVLQACEAIAEAHSLGIVHRDLKPANLFLTRRRDGSPLVKVLDFGISKALQESLTGSAPSVTSTTAVMGSPLYMSPEQVRSSKSVDARSDVWALGVILQELVTGHPTYVAETASALMAMIAADPPPPLRARRPDAPAQLEAAVLRCLEKDRDRRMPNVAELARAIAPFAAPNASASVERIARVLGDAAPSSLPQVSYDPARSVASSAGTGGTWERTQTGARPKRGALVAVVGLLLGGAVAIAGLLAWRARSGNALDASHTVDASSQPTAAAPPLPSVVTAVAPPVAASISPVAAAPIAAPEPAPTPSVAVSAQPVVKPRRAAPRRGGQPDLFDDNK
jgi:serine/threonine-protein kinase